MKVFDCSEGDTIVIDEKLILQVAEISEAEICLKIETSEDVRVCAKESCDTVA